MCLLFCFVLFWILCCVVCEKKTVMIPVRSERICSITVANSRETNKQPQLQKQAQNKPNIFFYDLLSSILFIINYLLPIYEPHIYSLKYIWVILWKCQFFLSLAFTEILHLKNTWLQFFLYFKMK